MANNPFSIENLAPTWVEATEILKGDTPGHEFHGNQYADGIGGAIKDLSDKLNGRTSNGRRGTPAQMEKAHKAIAEMHTAASKTASNNKGRIAHEQAAIAHYRAARIHRNPSEHEGVAEGRVKPTLGRQLATADAIDASRRTPEMNDAYLDGIYAAYEGYK
jgi:hypothetical protein